MSDRDMHDAADGEIRERAIESLTYKIISGKHRYSLFDLLDSELNGERYKIILEEIADLLSNDTGEREYKADQIVSGLINRYLSTHDDLIEEESADIEAHEEEDYEQF